MIVAGVGCRAGCPAEDIVLALGRAVEHGGLALADVNTLFSAEPKAMEAGLQRAAHELGKPLVFLPLAALAAQAAGALTASAAVAARFGLPSLAETAALAGAFELGERRAEPRLLSARHVAGGATCALARVEGLEERA